MTGAVFFAVSIALSAASTWLAWTHVRRVAGVLRPDAGALVLALKRAPAAERLPMLLARSAPGAFEHLLAAEALAASHEDAKIAAVNAALADIEHTIASGARWPATAVRIVFFGAGACAFLAYMTDAPALRWPVAIAALGGVALLACAQAERSGERLAAKQRRAVDDLVAAALSLPPGLAAPKAPERRRRAVAKP